MEQKHQPVVLCLSGLDPSGGAGIQADIETLASLGCHCAPIVTTLTAQDSSNVLELNSVDPALIDRQMAAIFADMPVAAVKIGLLGSVEVILQISAELAKHPGIPVILDPVLKASGGTELASQQVIEAIREHLLPLVFLITPNLNEAQRLCPEPAASDEVCASYLHAQGTPHVLITGGDSIGHQPDTVTNQLFSTTHDLDQGQLHDRSADPKKTMQTDSWPRLNGSFHGSGCTLAAAISGYISLGSPVEKAVTLAQQFTHDALEAAQPLGRGQLIPIRVSAE